MLVNEPTRRRSAESSGESDSAVCRLHLNAKRAKYIDAPAGPRVAIFVPSRHRRRNLAIDEPMASFDL